jgi:acetyl esterase/lipase
LLPEDQGLPASVVGVFTVSAPVDMPAMLAYHPAMAATAHPPSGVAYDPLVDLDPVAPPAPGASRRELLRWNRAQSRRVNGMLRDLLGGGPDEVPEMFRFASVGSHVRSGLPPTLLVQGDQDTLVPVGATRELAQALREAGVRVEYVELPQTDHGFELALPHLSPPALAALAAIKAFLKTL